MSSNSGEPSHWNIKNNIWSTIWKLHIPMEAKHFLWRVCNNIIPHEWIWLKGIFQTKHNALFAFKRRKPLCMHCGRSLQLVMCGVRKGVQSWSGGVKCIACWIFGLVVLTLCHQSYKAFVLLLCNTLVHVGFPKRSQVIFNATQQQGMYLAVIEEDAAIRLVQKSTSCQKLSKATTSTN